MEQPGLNFAAKDQNAATRLMGDFLAALADGHWHQGKTLLRDLGTNERVLRQMAADSRGSVISGQRGYRLTAHATTHEIDRAENWLKHQGMEMIKRAMLIRRSRNQGGRALRNRAGA